MLAHMQVTAQNCTGGSFGDPVTGSEDFGSGSNPGAALSTEQSNLTYQPDCNISDTEYTILNSVIGCHTEGWHNVLQDNTPDDVNGYMMVINATDRTDVSGTFYYKKISGLCPNTTYSFSAYILNLIRLDVDGPNAKHPDLTFSIELPGETLSTSTGKIGPTAKPEFHLYPTTPFCFTTGNNTTEVVLKITNNAPGGVGNDLILDDISFRAVGSPTTVRFSTTTDTRQEICAGESTSYQLNATVTDAAYQNYQWQVNRGTGWQDISAADNATANSKVFSLSINNAVAGTYKYRVGVAQAGNLASVNCRIYSEPLTITVNPLPVANAVDNIEFCEGETITVTATGGVRYEWNGPGLPANAPALNIPNATPANSGIYTVTAVSDKGCPSIPKSVTVKVNPKVTATIAAIQPICESDN
ncbi:MAG: hypothetical protein ABIN95_02435, partial [Mucilaginibacter sp.]